VGCYLQIIKRVAVKQVITEASKKMLRNKFEQEKEQLSIECQQLQFEQRKLKHQLHASKQEINNRFQQEIKARKDKIMMIDFKIEQLDMLEIGSEITENEVNALVQVQVGDRWDELNNKQSIIIKDNIVVRIDEE